jgi:hypothetical protein
VKKWLLSASQHKEIPGLEAFEVVFKRLSITIFLDKEKEIYLFIYLFILVVLELKIRASCHSTEKKCLMRIENIVPGPGMSN